jgi:transposase
MAVDWAMPLVVELTFAWLNQFRRLRVRYEKRPEIHEAFLYLACAFLGPSQGWKATTY